MTLPTDISGLKLWLKADVEAFSDAGVTPAVNGDTVRQWNDQSGNGNHLTQATAGARPAYFTGLLNIFTGVVLSGASKYMQAAGSLLGGSSAFTEIHVVKFGSLQNNILYGFDTNNLLWFAGGTVPVFYPSNCVTDVAPTLDAYTIIAGRYDGAAGVLYQQIYQDAIINAAKQHAFDGDGQLNLGAFAGGAATNDYTIYESMLYNRAITRTEHRALYDYLVGRWGLSAPSYTTKIVIAFEGDSITYGTGSAGTQGTATPGDGSYPARTMNLITSPSNYTTYNIAAGGSEFRFAVEGNTNNNPSSLFLAERAVLADRKLDFGPSAGILVLDCGTNDLSNGGDAASTEVDLKRYCLDRVSHGWTVLVCTIIDRGSEGAGQATFNAQRALLNTAIRTNYASYGAAGVIDFDSDSRLGTVGANANATYFSDTIHPTDAGYVIMAGIAAPVIQALLPAASATYRRTRSKLGTRIASRQV